jgi:hypothetical protein
MKMKCLRFMLSVGLLSLSTVAFAQSDAQKLVSQSDMQHSSAVPAPSEAQKSFATIKTLAGSWEGRLSTVPPQPDVEGKYALISLRVTSMGNALLHEIKIEGRADDPITMLYLDGDRLLLTHYCDAGNRPRMAARVSPDGKTVSFDFLDVVGSTRYGNMHDAVFTLIDADHHTEVWTWMGPDGKPTQARFELQRKN